MHHDVFISYSSHDKAIADAICSKLENNNIRCWIAPRDIIPGVEFGEAIINAISDCKILLLVFSAKANDSPQVRREVERAVSKGKIIIPYRIEDILPTKAMEYALSNTHWLDALNPPLEFHIAKLFDIIYKLIGHNLKGGKQDEIKTQTGENSKLKKDDLNIFISQSEVPLEQNNSDNPPQDLENYSGQIIRKDGSKENFTQFSFGKGDTRYFPFSTDMEGKVIREINGNDISKINIIGSTRLIQNGVYIKNIWAKSNITFRDNKKLENVYLNLSGLINGREWDYRTDFYIGKIDSDVSEIIFWKSPKPVKY